eukprot:1452306-Pyramimonas_sp.AAC.1
MAPPTAPAVDRWSAAGHWLWKARYWPMGGSAAMRTHLTSIVSLIVITIVQDEMHSSWRCQPA